jgi:peptidoglycan/xylan/chitin deacetylase (PgdA/CDA1 family)
MKPLSSLETRLLRGCGVLLAPGGRGGALLVLIYHRVFPTPDPLLTEEPDAQSFAAQMDLLREVCHVLPLAEGVERLQRGSLPRRAACITFDDGYANNCDVAAPILAARKLPATVFVATGYIGSGRMWNDTVIESVRCAGERLDLTDLELGAHTLSDATSRRSAIDNILRALKHLPQDVREAKSRAIAERTGCPTADGLMMSEAQIKQIAGMGIDIGAHTVTHPILTRLDETAARNEILASKAGLEAIVGAPVTTFAYPNGRPQRDYDRSHVEIVRAAGFQAAVSAAWGAAGPRADRYQIPRMLPWDTSSFSFALRLLRTYRERRAATV